MVNSLKRMPGEPSTTHNLSKVPFLISNPNKTNNQKEHFSSLSTKSNHSKINGEEDKSMTSPNTFPKGENIIPSKSSKKTSPSIKK